MLTVALQAMFPGIAHPERLLVVSIESFEARHAHTGGMLVEAQAAKLTFAHGSSKAERSPIEQSVG